METVVALFDEPAQAKSALGRLMERGFTRDHLGFSLLDVVAQEELAAETGVSHEDGAPAGVSAIFRGAGVGFLAGVGLALPTWLLLILIPDTRPLQIGGLYGVMFGALSGLGLGGAFGALSGGDHGDYVTLLRRMGVPERVALGYYNALKAGKVMVIARDQEQEMADEATRLLHAAGALDLDEGTGGGQMGSERTVKSGARRR